MIDIPVRRMVRAFGFDVERKRPILMDLLRQHRVDTVLDVGANVGQYVKRLRAWGYDGRAISFEPLHSAFAELERRAAGDDRWDVMKLALGEADAAGTIHVSEASVFSSIRKARPVLHRWYRTSVPVGTQEITVRRLDSIFADLNAGGRTIFLKVDTQGYEREVLRGATGSLRAICGVQLEMSLTPLYEGEPTMAEMLGAMEEHGFQMVLTEPVAWDPVSRALLQMDCVFFRRDDVS